MVSIFFASLQQEQLEKDELILNPDITSSSHKFFFKSFHIKKDILKGISLNQIYLRIGEVVPFFLRLSNAVEQENIPLLLKFQIALSFIPSLPIGVSRFDSKSLKA